MSETRIGPPATRAWAQAVDEAKTGGVTRQAAIISARRDHPELFRQVLAYRLAEYKELGTDAARSGVCAMLALTGTVSEDELLAGVEAALGA
jgi:hypothetical protein